MKYMILALVVWAIISFFLARKKKLQKLIVEDKEKNIFLEPDKESVIIQLKEIAQKTFKNREMPLEESEQYDINIGLKEGKISEVDIRSSRSIVKVTNKGITYIHRGPSQKDAIIFTWAMLMMVGITCELVLWCIEPFIAGVLKG